LTVTVRLPPALSERIDSRGEIAVTGDNIRTCLQAAAARYPVLGSLIWPRKHRLNPVILIFHNSELIREEQLNRPVADGDEIDVVPAIEGG
jgi:molybdopterin converting factor small subunit